MFQPLEIKRAYPQLDGRFTLKVHEYIFVSVSLSSDA